DVGAGVVPAAFPAGGEVGGPGGQSGEDAGVPQEVDGAGDGAVEADPVDAVVEGVADVAERDGAADAGDDHVRVRHVLRAEGDAAEGLDADEGDRKSTRLNSSHVKISYAVFCLK